MEGENHVGADRGEAVAHVVVESAADGGNANDYGNANHDAEDGQTRAQLVGADGFDRDPQNFAEFALAHRERPQ